MTCRWQVRAAELTAAFSPQRKCKNVRFKSHLRNQTKQKQPIASATLAEKTRTPPRNFLWWCFSIDVNLRKAPSGRELSPQATEGECVTIKRANLKFRRLLPPLSRSPFLPEEGFCEPFFCGWWIRASARFGAVDCHALCLPRARVSGK